MSVAQARRRLTLAIALRVWPWSASIALGCGAALVAGAKSAGSELSWPLVLVATTGCAAVVTAAWSLLRRPSFDAAAIEFDRRCRLQERVATALATRVDVVVYDALRRIADLDLAASFPYAWNVRSRWPLACAVALFAAAAAWPAARDAGSMRNVPDAEEAEAVRSGLSSLEKMLARRREEALALSSLEAAAILERLREQARAMQASANPPARREAMFELNDMAEELARRRDELSAGDRLRRELRAGGGAATSGDDAFTKALRQGEFTGAAEAMEQLSRDLARPNVVAAEREKLAERLEEWSDQLERLADDARTESAADSPKRSHDPAVSSTDGTPDETSPPSETSAASSDGNKAQPQSASPSEAWQGLSRALAQTADELRDDSGAAAGQRQLTSALEKLGADAAEGELLERAQQDIAEAKSQLRENASTDTSGGPQNEVPGEGVAGETDRSPGEPGRAGMSPTDAKPEPSGSQGIGTGSRERKPIPAGSTSEADEGRIVRTRGKVGPGELRIDGPAGGPNAKALVQNAIRRQAAQIDGGSETQKVENQPLERGRRDQKRQYFDALRNEP